MHLRSCLGRKKKYFSCLNIFCRIFTNIFSNNSRVSKMSVKIYRTSRKNMETTKMLVLYFDSIEYLINDQL